MTYVYMIRAKGISKMWWSSWAPHSTHLPRSNKYFHLTVKLPLSQ